MHNKVLKGALIGTIVFSVLYELVALIGHYFIVRIAHLFTDMGLVYDIFNHMQNGLYGLTQLAFIIAGLAFLLANTKSLQAVLGGCVLSLRALMLLSQAILWTVFGLIGAFLDYASFLNQSLQAFFVGKMVFHTFQLLRADRTGGPGDQR